MSTDEEIAAVYNEDIERKTRAVWNRRGIDPFLSGMKGYRVFKMYSEPFTIPNDKELPNATDSERKTSSEKDAEDLWEEER